MSAERTLSDRQAEAINRAILLRLLHNYVEAKDNLSVDGLPHVGLSLIEIGERYRKLIDEWLSEDVTTATVAQARVELVTLTLIDGPLTNMLDMTTIAGDERDRQDAIKALSGVADWIMKLANSELVEAERQRV
jgi:hypothetical protein